MADLSNDQARFAGLGLQFALTLVLLGAVGWWIDSKLGTQPWLLVAGLVAGGVLAFWQLLRSVPPARGRKAVPLTKDPPDPKS